MSESQTKVFLVEDHEAMRYGLRAILKTEDSVVVVGEATTAAEALEMIPAARPDVVLLDLGLPDEDGLSICRKLRSRHPDLRFLVLTAETDEEMAVKAVFAGAAGYVLKTARADVIRSAVRRVGAGESVLDTEVVRRLKKRAAGGAGDWAKGLNDQDREILVLTQQGLTNEQIAEKLSIAEMEVNASVSRILSRINTVRSPS